MNQLLILLLIPVVLLTATRLPSFETVQHAVDSILSNVNDTQAAVNDDAVVGNIFGHFKQIHKKTYYSKKEEDKRYALFKANVKHITITNMNKKNAFQLAINEYSDYTAEEFAAERKGLKLIKNTLIRGKRVASLLSSSTTSSTRSTTTTTSSTRSTTTTSTSTTAVPSTLCTNTSCDWRTVVNGVSFVTSIKDQGRCGSCYAFAFVAQIESLLAIKFNRNSSDLSPQQIIDCSYATNGSSNAGCNGGNWYWSAVYLQSVGFNFATWASYPYNGAVNSCRSQTAIKINIGQLRYREVVEQDEIALKQAVALGPVWVGINADNRYFSHYASGIINPSDCGNTVNDLNHAVLVVGYGRDQNLNLDYWIIRNSWGQSWGEKGYFRMARNKNKMCGISVWNDAAYLV
ncbi:unnamed protein product [Didymodactylos carnosus]|uniref:Uncharacterized protein n=1 Tax=Didymodactylos carnosus TaxID=1234261 RepID=A0A815Y9X8_9BILA|nr:unnamed protein product [Didymodactylos carnosus]CAF1567924.1 unnamed protein product [Didymodactylos carnosus]CAF3704407.1 unnamed protein product [Didymodactylos carnosus]CAF4430450.1 unnamed protein product [Didymodactylos carnosus]